MLIGQNNYVTVMIGCHEQNYLAMRNWLFVLKLPPQEQIRYIDGSGFTFHLHPMYAKQFIKEFDLDYEIED